MNLQMVPARTGMLWVRQGLNIFWRQPLAFSGLFFLFMAVVSLVSLVPVVGSVLALMLLPALSTGMMAATRVALSGRFPMPGVLFIAFRPGPARPAMVQLGGLYAVGFLLMMGLSALIDGGQFAATYLGQTPITPERVNGDAFQLALWFSMLLYAPFSMLFWHSPALVQWQAVPPVKSLFFSWMACWRNLGAFLVYVSLWALMFAGAGALALTASLLLGDPSWMVTLLMPLALLVAAMFFASMLYTVEGSFSLPTPMHEEPPAA